MTAVISREGRRRSALLKIILPLCLIVICWITRSYWLEKLAAFLVVNDEPVKSGAIVAVSGEHSRRLWAMHLYGQGFAGLLIFNVSDTTYYFGQGIDPVKSVLGAAAERGIPSDSIIINTNIASTYEDALASREIAAKLGLKSLLVVSSPFTTRRVSMTYRKVMRDLPVRLSFVSVPMELEKVSLDQWWTRERELVAVNNEYLKIVFYYFKYFL